MLVYGTRARAEQRRRQLVASDGLQYYKSEWMESGEDPTLSPTIFLVEQPAGSVLAPHFHRQNQFQLFVAGGGRIGHETLGAVTVHYAGAYTGYGPLVANDEGIEYFTIRPVYETGALYSIESRDQMKRGPKRIATSKSLSPLSEEALEVLAKPEVIDAIPIGADGMGAQRFRLPPGTSADLSMPPAAQGCFAVVLAGSVVHAEKVLERWESIYGSTQAEIAPLRAGPRGAELILLYVPAKAEAYL